MMPVFHSDGRHFGAAHGHDERRDRIFEQAPGHGALFRCNPASIVIWKYSPHTCVYCNFQRLYGPSPSLHMEEIFLSNFKK
jgi:hypothetical protein